MNRFVFPAILALAFVARGAPVELGQLDASPTLFTVLAALNAAGFDADLSSPNNHPLRNAIRVELGKRNLPSLEALKAFFAKNRKRDDTSELNQYISYALIAGMPPSFAARRSDAEIPPDANAVMGLTPLLAAFYKEANIEDLWKRSQPAIDQYIARYHGPISEAVLQVNAYLRQQTSGFRGRRFQVLIELLAPPNQIQTRSYGDEYTLVITPSPQLRTFDVRHAYLHYLLDPLATRYHEVLERKQGLLDHAQRAPALDESFKSDFLLMTTESLIKAVEARLDHKPQAVQEALSAGFILAPYFGEQLARFEKQEQSMLVYYPDMVMSIDLIAEDARLTNVEFRRDAPVKTVRIETPVAPLSGAAKTLDDAEQLYVARDLEKARKAYLESLKQTDRKPMHAAAYYGLARIAVLQKDPETAERLFKKTLDSEPEGPVKAWALVYLGRLAMAAGDREQAIKRFQGALLVDGASPAAHDAAIRGVDSSKQ